MILTMTIAPVSFKEFAIRSRTAKLQHAKGEQVIKTVQFPQSHSYQAQAGR